MIVNIVEFICQPKSDPPKKRWETQGALHSIQKIILMDKFCSTSIKKEISIKQEPFYPALPEELSRHCSTFNMWNVTKTIYHKSPFHSSDNNDFSISHMVTHACCDKSLFIILFILTGSQDASTVWQSDKVQAGRTLR